MAQETIISKAYELLKVSLPIVEKIPRSHKFTLGDRLETHLMDLLELLIEAFYVPRSQKLPILHRGNILLEKIRYLIRLAHDLHFLRNAQYEELSTRLLEIGRMTGGWIKSLDPNQKKFVTAFGGPEPIKRKRKRKKG
jgi:hypothetical protein